MAPEVLQPPTLKGLLPTSELIETPDPGVVDLFCKRSDKFEI